MAGFAALTSSFETREEEMRVEVAAVRGFRHRDGFVKVLVIVVPDRCYAGKSDLCDVESGLACDSLRFACESDDAQAVLGKPSAKP